MTMPPREAGIQAFYADEGTSNTLQGLNAAFDAYEAAEATECERLRGTLRYILAQAEQGYPTVLSVIKANAKAALDDKWQGTVREALSALSKAKEA